MTSEMAVEDIEQMQAEGLKPTVKDIIRLNALALKYERAKSRNADNSIYLMPRIAFIDSKHFFRQPTIGHEIWFDKVSQVADYGYQTTFALRAYALSRDCDELCDPYDREKLVEEVEKFLDSVKHSTEDQIFAALNYVQNGLYSDSCEYPAPAKDDKEDNEVEDWRECIAIGTLHEAQTILYGVSAAEAMKMTRPELDTVIHRAYAVQGLSGEKSGNYELGCYYRTLDDIRIRLEKENKESEDK